jgi:DNA modification methylase
MSSEILLLATESTGGAMTLAEIVRAIGMEPYHQEDAGVIYCADCLDILPKIPDKSIDLVLTDPPYGVGKAEWDMNFHIDWVKSVQLIRPNILAFMPGIANIVNFPPRFGLELEYKWMLIAYLKNSMTRSPFGYGKYIPLLVYTNPVEEIKLYAKDRDLQGCLVRESGESMSDHPCPKPNGAIRYFLSVLPGNIIVDPFLGSGTTAIIAKQLGRKFIGIEIEEKYCKIAVQRLAQGVLL